MRAVLRRSCRGLRAPGWPFLLLGVVAAMVRRSEEKGALGRDYPSLYGYFDGLEDLGWIS